MKKSFSVKHSIIAFFLFAVMFAVTGITVNAQEPADLHQTEASEYSVKVEWTGIAGAQYYGYQIATDAGFANIVKNEYVSASFNSVQITGLNEGSTYYVRVGYGSTYRNCYNNFSQAIDVVTTPNKVSNLKYVSANDSTATIAWTPSAGASGYEIVYNNAVLTTTAVSYAIPLVDGVEASAAVRAYRVSSTGYKTVSREESIYKLSKLTKKIDKDYFGIHTAYSNINVFYFLAIGYGYGYELEGETVSGAKYTFSGSNYLGNDIRIDSLKQSAMYKYHVRAYIETTDGQKVYGDWSDYRYICNPKNDKYMTGGRKIKLKWKKLSGVSKVKVMLSTKENSGFKTVATVSGKKTSCTISKLGKKKLKKNKKYYVRVLYQFKDGGSMQTSDLYKIATVKVR